ncbi:hypothetical protein UFOVP1346_58 [uncultured Caudovirales phage]|uniref:Uncharacterized protein n=1 Tax=uncultured Caudovirales phage TaxID=2100421 RepID=A0A6J5QS23_9CAUD|nr:hypothetical protein UFOVP921_38 [uncultured Caudovirales phage]CAB4187320.1 hypothetical protein UFOVP1156_14 [uncultured Caudovirales phage]CAB4200695.1 hypothetical protein UFOVP1346_58 [uncultured Caudovirales phage]
MLTPWGVSEGIEPAFRTETIIFVWTGGHGGWGIQTNSAEWKRLSPLSLAFSKKWSHGMETVSGYQWFEEDCGYNYLLADLPEIVSSLPVLEVS